MIELFQRRHPLNEVIFFAVVLEMAADAFLTVWIAHFDLGVKPVFCGEPLGDLFVTI
jgi:hypothetical protein